MMSSLSVCFLCCNVFHFGFDKCILHTPTAIDMYCKRSKLLKKQGNLALAAGSCSCSSLCLVYQFLIFIWSL